MRTGQVKALWVWSLWMGLGAALGGVVIAVLAGLLGLFASGGGVAPDLAGALAMIGAVLGAVGGVVAGFVCAAITRLLDRARGGSTAGGYAAVAATVTATLTSVVGGGLFRPDPTRIGEAVVWLAVPVVVSTAVAAMTGWWIWGWAHIPQPRHELRVGFAGTVLRRRRPCRCS